MADVVLYHNTGCSTSRTVHGLLRDGDVDVDVVEYLKRPLDRAALLELIGQLDSEPASLVRKDPFFKELGLDADDYVTPEAVADLLVEHPRLMQRPVVVSGGTATIGRPPDKIPDWLAAQC
jgi:arsenate reductase